MIIAINAGHSDADPGACGEYSQEADICVSVSKKVCSILEARGHVTEFIHEDELSDVCDNADLVGADIFVSIHCNAAGSPAAQGTETFFYPIEDSEQLAFGIQNNLVDALQTVDRGIKDGSWLYVLNNTAANPCALVEIAFISNPEEEKLLNERQDDIAIAISNGILEYIDGADYN